MQIKVLWFSRLGLRLERAQNSSVLRREPIKWWCREEGNRLIIVACRLAFAHFNWYSAAVGEKLEFLEQWITKWAERNDWAGRETCRWTAKNISPKLHGIPAWWKVLLTVVSRAQRKSTKTLAIHCRRCFQLLMLKPWRLRQSATFHGL